MTTHFNIIEAYYVESIGKNVLLVSSYDIGYSVITVIDDKPFMAVIGSKININKLIYIHIKVTAGHYFLHVNSNPNTYAQSYNLYGYAECNYISTHDVDKFIKENIDLIEGDGPPILK